MYGGLFNTNSSLSVAFSIVRVLLFCRVMLDWISPSEKPLCGIWAFCEMMLVGRDVRLMAGHTALRSIDCAGV
jgi:hypothetical protein